MNMNVFSIIQSLSFFPSLKSYSGPDWTSQQAEFMFDNPILKSNWTAKHFLPYKKELKLTSKEKCGHQNIPDWFFSMVRSLTEPTSECNQ